MQTHVHSHRCTHTGAHTCALRALARPGQARDSHSATSVRRTTPTPPHHIPPCPHSPMDFSAGQGHFGWTAETLHARWGREGTGSWWRGAVGPKARPAESRLPATRPPHKTYSRVGEKHLIPWRSVGSPIMGTQGAQHSPVDTFVRVRPGRGCWPGGDRRAVAPGKKGTSTVCHLSRQPQPASPHFQIRKKFSSDTLLNVCPTNPEVGRDGGVGGEQYFLSIVLRWVFWHSYFLELLRPVRSVKMSSVRFSEKDAQLNQGMAA